VPRNQYSDQVYLILDYQNIMSVPYDDSTQKDWKERKEKIEGYYREIGKMGTVDNKKISSISVVKSGDKLVVQLDDGDGILYEIIEDLVNPLRMIQTLSQNEIEKLQSLTK
tara:strand:- start:346 stop:678 length:333 start_codon:yes stop_codon:yes gene_type:complete